MKYTDFTEDKEIQFTVGKERYVVAKLSKIPRFQDGMLAIIRDKNEITVIAQEDLNLKTLEVVKGFKLITFVVRLPFELCGFISYISGLLAEQEIPLYIFSSFSTDHILIKEADLDKTISVLEKNGFVLSQQHTLF